MYSDRIKSSDCVTMFLYIWLGVCIMGSSINCAPVKYPQAPSPNVLEFMKKYGYIEEDDGNSEALYTEEGISNIIKTVQKFGAINETGIIDNATLNLMSSPRCGVPDIIKRRRGKRFILATGWEKRNITYFVANWTPKLSEVSVVKNIQKALDTWGGYGRLYFHRAYDPNADIIVAFASGFHGDSFPFDGPGNILAHAFFPYEFSDLGGDIHFDDDEKWIDNSLGEQDGTDFYTVALHELGHSLGLAHSPMPNSVMFPYYKNTDANSAIQLGYDDILAMYKLYITRQLKDDTYNPPTYDYDDSSSFSGEYSTEWTVTSEITSSSPTAQTTISTINTEKPTTLPTDQRTVTYEGDTETVDDHKNHDDKHNVPDTNSPSLPDICDGKIDAMANLRNELFVFRDQYIWRYSDKRRLETGYPVPLRSMFSKLPKDIKKIDAIYQRPDSMIILFTGNVFWVSDGRNFFENSPRPLTDYGLPDYLSSIDAVQTWGKNKKTYFYKNERFWRFNETSKSMDAGYPLHMERWRGVPHNLDAAVTWKDGVTYFFKDDRFWKFDNDWIITTEESPLPTAQIWFGCPEDVQRMMKWY